MYSKKSKMKKYLNEDVSKTNLVGFVSIVNVQTKVSLNYHVILVHLFWAVLLVTLKEIYG